MYFALRVFAGVWCEKVRLLQMRLLQIRLLQIRLHPTFSNLNLCRMRLTAKLPSPRPIIYFPAADMRPTQIVFNAPVLIVSDAQGIDGFSAAISRIIRTQHAPPRRTSDSSADESGDTD